MTNALPSPPLLLITDRRHTVLPLIEIVGAALSAGCRWIMVREKDLDRAALVALAAPIADAAAPFGARVLINGDIGAAAASGASGAHVQSAASVAEARGTLGPEAIIGVSAHRLSDVALAADCGADYATLSPVFETRSKPGYGPQIGLGGLRRHCAASPLPIVALGGLTPRNARACMKNGAAGIATMGSVMRAPDPGQVIEAFVDALSRDRK